MKKKRGRYRTKEEVQALFDAGPPHCACRFCGLFTNWNKRTRKWAKYISGHNGRGIPRSEETKRKTGNANKINLLGKKHTQETKEKMSDTHKKRFEDNPELKKERSKMVKDYFKNNPEARINLSKVNTGKKLSKETREKQSKSTIKCMQDAPDKHFAYKSGFYFSKKNNKKLHYRSSYELIAYQILESLSKVKSYKVEPIKIKYFDGEINRNTIPDLLITYMDGSKELIEVKAQWEIDKRQKTRAKLQAMAQYAKLKNWLFSIWTEKELGLV